MHCKFFLQPVAAHGHEPSPCLDQWEISEIETIIKDSMVISQQY
jgi:hypothetical protein